MVCQPPSARGERAVWKFQLHEPVHGQSLRGFPARIAKHGDTPRPYPSQYFRFTDWNFYGQDDFKVTPKLTLSYGLRYEYHGPASTRDGNIYSFDPASGSIVIPSEDSRRLFSPYWPADVPIITADQLGAGKSLREADNNNFAPRFGFSYQIGNDARTVLRGGWGVYYSHLSANVAAGLAAGPYAISTTSNNNFVDGQPLFTFENPFAAPGAAGSLNVNAVDTRLLNSYAMQYSLSLERQVTQDIGVRVSYIGSKGTQVLYRRNINQPEPSTVPFSASRRPYPRFNTIAWGENGANDLYNGLQTQVQKRFSKGLLFNSTWTWA
ncbi:MAG: TonB-dependent receptor, partial [Bryobacteraceae bacterium]|nr:TonB-dependent receptor [Bryobacteraceae bacterium]